MGRVIYVVVLALLAIQCAPRPRKVISFATHRVYNLQLTPVVEGGIVKHFVAPPDADIDTFAVYRNGIRHQKDFHYTVVIDPDGSILIVPSHTWYPNELITLDYSLKY